MIWEKFKDFFHESWWKDIKPFIESEECNQIYAYLKQRSKEGVKILPPSHLTYRVFKEVPLDGIKVVVLGYCPYHSIDNDVPVADGIAFSCSATEKLQPSLATWYEGIENDLYNGLNLNYEKNPDLSYLLTQGIFLWNSSLTVEHNNPGSHQILWKPFTKYVLEKILYYKDIPYVLVGKDAQYYSQFIKYGTIFKIDHPSYAARTKTLWDTQGVFRKINEKVFVDWLDEDLPPF